MWLQRREFSREFKLEAVKLVRERGVSVAQAVRDVDVHENVLRKWVREREADSGSAFSGNGVMKPEQQEFLAGPFMWSASPRAADACSRSEGSSPASRLAE